MKIHQLAYDALLSAPLPASLGPGAVRTFRARKLGNLVTATREFAALVGIDRLPILNAFLNPPWREEVRLLMFVRI